MTERFYLAGKSKYGFHIVGDRDIDRSASFVPEWPVQDTIDSLNADPSVDAGIHWDSPARTPATKDTTDG